MTLVHPLELLVDLSLAASILFGLGCGFFVLRNLRLSGRIDPILGERLENAAEPSKSVSAVVKLKPGDPVKATLPPEKMREITEAVLAKARERSGQTELDYFVLEAVGAFNLVAPVGFLADVLNQPEVASVYSAETGEPERLLLHQHLLVRTGFKTPSGPFRINELNRPEGGFEIGSKGFIPVRELSLVHPTRIASASPQPGVAWGLVRMNIPYLWAQGLDGTGIKIGHLDTGADGTHPMLHDAFAAFWESNYIGRPIEPSPDPHDTDIHGTHTAGTLVGREVNGFRMGVAPGAKLASGIVIEGGRVTFRILGALNWVLEQNVRVLSMSLGIAGVAVEFLDITKILRDRRVFLAFAIGNDGPGTSRSPGNYAGMMSVGAMDDNNQVSLFSSSYIVGDRIAPDLVAPGVGIVSCVPGNKYAAMDGTSMAAPHVAGLAALLFQAKPDATVEEVQEAIYSSCNRPATMAKERANRGVPDGKLALNHLLAR